MSEALEIVLTPERLDEGTPEERACFGLLCIRMGDLELVSGFDHYTNGYRAGPLVSGYHLGEWLSWNWWRLMWEPRTSAPAWWRAHTMTAIGEGYSWPRLTIYSDGVRTVLHSKGSVRNDAKPFRYLGAHPVIVPQRAFESAVDDFLGKLVARLHETGILTSNLRSLWSDVLAEREDPNTAQRRKLEALLGRDPESDDERDLEKLIADAHDLGEGAIEELAAESGQANRIYTAESLREFANKVGRDTRPRDAVRLRSVDDLRPRADVPAWEIGSMAARRLREQEKLGNDSISDATLSRLSGFDSQALGDEDIAPISFSLDRSPVSGQMVFRSRWKTGRRFEAARVLADRLIADGGDRLRAATRAYTYRQKMQRSFAAEFLSPFEAVEAMLANDYSAEALEDAARHFEVSERTIRTLLVNHGRLDREELDADLPSAA